MDLQLKGSSFLLTGATRGLGLAAASALVAEGASVTITGRSPETVEKALAILGPSASGVAADNGDPGTAERLVDAVIERFSRLDGALISVGGPPPSSVLETSDEAWRTGVETLFLGALRITRACMDRMNPGGAIAFVLSSSVRTPIPDLAISNAIRPALAMTAKALADEVGPRNIRVVGLAPGRVETERTREYDDLHPGSREASERAIPLRRLGRPDEFGRVAAFLLSPAASYMTGCIVPIDGGMIRTL